MAKRLGKLCNELNIGFDTAIAFLKKKGITEELDINQKLTDEQELLLNKEFSKDKDLKQQSEEILKERMQKSNTQTIVAEGYENPVVEPTPKANNEDSNNAPKANDTIVQPAEPTNDNNSNNTTTAEATQPQKQETATPAATQQAEQTTPSTAAKQTADDNAVPNQAKEGKAHNKDVKTVAVQTVPQVEINKEGATTITGKQIVEGQKGPAVTVLGTINLGDINPKTRPASKEEQGKKNKDKDKDKDKNKNKNNDRKPQGDKQQGQGDGKGKNKRNRIDHVKIDITANVPKGNGNGNNNNANKPKGKGDNKGKTKPHKGVQPQPQVDIDKQIKDTLARLNEKSNATKSGAKHRRLKRDNVQERLQEQAAREREELKVLKLTEFVTVNDLATMMNVPVTDVISTCFNLGMIVSINQRVDAETIKIVADEFGFATEFVSAEVAHAIQEEPVNTEALVSRPPIVTVMGHVDHGKTSLLDYIRKSNVIAGEAGGITQHIGAYNVTLEDGRHITFLDTPGHEAFTAMRARGAQVTDIAIIIVAADDDVMPQTVEAINHASAAGVPIVFAINKIDKPGANPEKVKESLSAMNYLVEDWGGKYQSQDISAKKGIGVNELLEKVLLEAELLDLKADPTRKASGSIIESTLDKGRGYTATVLVQNGTLRIGDVVLAGTSYGRIKAMFNERNQRIKEAGPSEPVIILGLNGAPQAGDKFNVFQAEHEAREVANTREQLQREQGLRTSKHMTLDEIGRRIAMGNFQEMNIIVKGDVDGSIEALSDSLIKLSTPEIQVNIVHKAVGQISESDVLLATASNAIIVGFQVRPSMAARKLAEQEQIDIRLYSIIYDAIEEVKAAMEGMLSPEVKEEITATLEILQTFKISKVGTIAGCLVKDGKIKRTNKVRIIRDGIVVYTGELASLKRVKDDVKEVQSGMECGLNIANYNDIKVGDIIEAYEQVESKRTL